MSILVKEKQKNRSTDRDGKDRIAMKVDLDRVGAGVC